MIRTNNKETGAEFYYFNNDPELIATSTHMNLSEVLIDTLKYFGLKKLFFYDKKGDRTLNIYEAEKIYIDELKTLLNIKNNIVEIYVISQKTIEKNNLLFSQIKKLAFQYSKGVKYYFTDKEFLPKNVLMNIWENINNKKHYSILKNNKWENKMIKENPSNIINEAPLGRKPKEKINFKETPEIKKWADFLEKLYVYTSNIGDKTTLLDLNKEDFYMQAERIVSNKIKASPTAKALVKTTTYSIDPDIKKNQQLYEFYGSISQLLDSSKDFIIGNIISRLASHYFYKINNHTTSYNENSMNFKALVKFAKWIGEKVGLREKDFVKEGKFESYFEKVLKEWFDKFTFENIFLKESKEKNRKKIKESRKSGMKAAAVVKSGEKILSSLEKAGSPREHAFAKALYYYEKGLDSSESLLRANLLDDEKTKQEFRKLIKQRGLKPSSPSQKKEEEKYADKYEKMYLKKQDLFTKEPITKK